jgi:hypothetical protein
MTAGLQRAACLASLLAFTGAVSARDPNIVLVRPDSPVIRALYDQPLTADRYPLFVAMYKFNIAGDRRAEDAVREFLRRSAVYEVGGMPFEPKGTIGRIVQDQAALPALRDGVVANVVAGALHVRLVPDAGKSLSGAWGETFKSVAPALWVGQVAGSPSHAHVLLEVENATGLVMTYIDVSLHLEGNGEGGPREMPCRSTARPFRQLIPGGKDVFDCFLHQTEVAANLGALVQGVRGWQQDPSRIPLSNVRLGFANLGAILRSDGVTEIDLTDAFVDARTQLEQASCRARGACIGDLERNIQQNALFLVIAAGAVVGALFGIAMSRRRKAPAAAPVPAPAAATTTSAPGRFRSVAGFAVLGAYLTLLVLCAVFVYIDSPWKANRSGMDGVVAFLASCVAGFPESIVVLFAGDGRMSDNTFVVLCWVFVPLNVAIMSWICVFWGRRRTPPHT